MVSPTFTVAGKTYPKTLIYAVGAGVAGIAGYAWWTRGREEIPPEPAVDTEYPSPITPAYTGGASGYFDVTPDKYESDQEWYSDALQKLLYDYGISDTPIASEVLDKYLAQQPLTAEQQKMIAFVINSIGPPPSGTRTIRTETKPPTTALTAPSNFYAVVRGDNRVNISWGLVPGALGYEIRDVAGGSWLRQASNLHTTNILGPRVYNYEVKAFDSNNNYGPSAFTTFTII